MERRTKRIEILFTGAEYDRLKERSGSFKSISSYIRAALSEFSDKDAKRRMDAVENMALICRRLQDELGWAGSTLNQAMKRANELAVAGLLSGTYYKEVVMPSIEDIKRVIDTMRKEHSDAVSKIIRATLRRDAPDKR